MKRIAMVVVDRANWGRLAPLAQALLAEFELDIIAGGAAADHDFGAVPVHRVRHVVQGDNLEATTRTIGFGVTEFAHAFSRAASHDRYASPIRFVLIIGDRREALAAAIAAAHSGAKLVHLQGGETSGTLDQKYRWAITALADYHFPATRAAGHTILDVLYAQRGCNRDREFNSDVEAMLLSNPFPGAPWQGGRYGCPSSDLAREVLAELHQPVDVTTIRDASRKMLSPSRTPEVLVCYHPNTCHPETAAEEAQALFSALPADRPITVLSTNPDAGRGPIVEACKRHGYAMQNLEPREFARRLATCSLAVGNSSGFVRDSGFYGTPVVLVGDRQNGRERSDNVMQVACIKGEIEAGIAWQLEHGPYPPSDLYGDGRVCERIVEALRKL